MTPGLMYPKDRPHALAKRDREADKVALDRRERAKCHKRSGGMCEVRTREERTILNPGGESSYRMNFTFRCTRRATSNHHLKGGIGRKNIGPSILARHRLDTCQQCHDDITKHILQPVGEGREDAATVRYERQR